jgi:hypothetical protein
MGQSEEWEYARSGIFRCYIPYTSRAATTGAAKD